MDLRVAKAYRKDVGRGIVRVDPEVMEKLGLLSGDVVEIIGKNRVPAIVWPGYPEDRGKEIIRMDGNLRSNAGVGIDDRVKIRKVAAKPAERVVLAPTEPIRLMGGERYLLSILQGRPVIRGQKIRVEDFGRALTLVIVSTRPSGVVTVTVMTEIEFKEKTIDIASSIEGWIKRRRERKQRISYYKSKIKTWKEEGYSVELGELKDLELAERKIREYESRIQKLKKIERELSSLKAEGFEEKVQSIRSKLRDPEKAEQAEKEFLELKRNIEEFERMKKEIIDMIDSVMR